MRPLRRTATVAAALLTLTALVACGSADDGDGTASAPTTAATDATTTPGAATTAPAKPERTVIEVTMTGGKVEPAPRAVDVKKGTKVRIKVTRDTDGEVHVHGLKEDIHAHAHADEPVNLDFVADTQGSFEVEAHDPDRSLLTLQVR